MGSVEEKIDWIKETGEGFLKELRELDGDVNFESFLEIVPKALDSSKLAIPFGALKKRQRNELAYELICYLVDETDAWGPDGIIDPVVKACAKAFLIGNGDD